MALNSSLFVVMVAATIDFSFATMVTVNHEAFAAENRSQSHITFSSASYTLEKTKTDVKRGSEGWAETSEVNPGGSVTGEWKVNADAAKLEGKWAGANNSGKWDLIKIE
jgi:hypothetical protein